MLKNIHIDQKLEQTGPSPPHVCLTFSQHDQTRCQSYPDNQLSPNILLILASYQCIECLLDFCLSVQCKLYTAPLNYTLPYSLANPAPTRQQIQLVRLSTDWTLEKTFYSCSVSMGTWEKTLGMSHEWWRMSNLLWGQMLVICKPNPFPNWPLTPINRAQPFFLLPAGSQAQPPS